jgi:hypothetical protein
MTHGRRVSWYYRYYIKSAREIIASVYSGRKLVRANLGAMKWIILIKSLKVSSSTSTMIMPCDGPEWCASEPGVSGRAPALPSAILVAIVRNRAQNFLRNQDQLSQGAAGYDEKIAIVIGGVGRDGRLQGVLDEF